MTNVKAWGVGGFLLGVLGCTADASSSGQNAGDPAPENARAGEIRESETWKDGTVLTGAVSIAPEAVVTIAPGAKITCAQGAAIVVGGELPARAEAKPATISCTSWNGLLLAKGGKIDLEGVSLENARTAITTTEGALASRFAAASITLSLNPFQIGKGSSLTVSHVKVTTPPKPTATEVSVSEIRGTMTASHLDYDAVVSEGIRVRDGGELAIEDSSVHGSGALDLVSAYDAKKLTVRYTLLGGAHCGLHIQGVDLFEVDHVTSENTYGVTLYESGAGPHVLSDSNMTGGAAWLDFQGDHGPIRMSNVYVKGSEIIKGGPAPTITKASSPIADAKPR